MKSRITSALPQLCQAFGNQLHTDELIQRIYATDASVYRVLPSAVFVPKSEKDLSLFMDLAHQIEIPIIPRATGTSLAGQCVGEGIVIDLSQLHERSIDLNPTDNTVTVSPNIIRDDLNRKLEAHGVFFGPNTSTSNRCQIGGMIGNNSSGTTSIQYGTTRDKLISLRLLLSDGSIIKTESLTKTEALAKAALDSLEGRIYAAVIKILEEPSLQKHILQRFPKPSIHRRNSGYALDVLYHQWHDSEEPHLNLSHLVAGSEGTLAIVLEATLQLDPLPPGCKAMIALHFESIADSLKATKAAMQYQPYLCELMDRTVLECTQGHPKYQKLQRHILGNPEAVLMLTLRADSDRDLQYQIDQLLSDAAIRQYCTEAPVLHPPLDQDLVLLRKAGLGLLANLPGDTKAVACIEDTAVDLQDLPDYVEEFTKIMLQHDQKAVYYAHAGAGELHLRPLLNLKTKQGLSDFVSISRQSAELVRKYQGSLSGEHGDGIVRSGFLPLVYGEEIMSAFRQIKKSWDPKQLLNPGKIIDPLPMDQNLRYAIDRHEPEIDSFYDFQKEGGMLRMAEKCNGSGDCRKSPVAGGTMCPSYHATQDEKDTTRARANVLREILTDNSIHPWTHPDLDQALDLCLSCKGCTSECPSQVNMTLLKSEWQYQKAQKLGYSARSRRFALNARSLAKLGYFRPWISTLLNSKWVGRPLKKSMGIHPDRPVPHLSARTLRHWHKRNYQSTPQNERKVYLFVDAFTEYQDVAVGIKTIQLLSGLGYEVLLVDHPESGRAALSKGFLEYARQCADKNVDFWSSRINEHTPLVGIEPSAILSFRDEYPRLVSEHLRDTATILSPYCLTIDEFLFAEAEKGHIHSASFDETPCRILLHGHCHQKALSAIGNTAHVLSLVPGYEVELLDTGCCGMAGSFGYEAEHYDLSMKIAELRLFPALRQDPDAIFCAPGISCRHQISDGLKVKSYHTVELLHRALKR